MLFTVEKISKTFLYVYDFIAVYSRSQKQSSLSHCASLHHNQFIVATSVRPDAQTLFFRPRCAFVVVYYCVDAGVCDFKCTRLYL